jgi:membrane-bound metal-dependent hydrolase YbcI (DUF457 family)
MKLATHSITGSIFGASIYSIHQKVNGGEIIGADTVLCTLVALFGSILPDLFDPPKSYKHRSIGHSWVLLVISIIVILLILKFGKLNYKLIVVESFFAGYASHLALDSTTSMGLPLIK